MLIPSLLASTLVATSVVAKHCQNLSVPVTIRARNGVFNVATLRDNHDATTFFANFTKPKANFSNEVLLGYQTIDNTYDISVKFCQPDTGYGQTVQLLTHGKAHFGIISSCLRMLFELRDVLQEQVNHFTTYCTL